jgi:Leucine-rich repeat (LRR) protein
MKRLLYLLLLTPIIYLSSCSKSGVTPQVDTNIEETIIVGKTWKLLNLDESWFILNADNTYLTKDYQCDSLEQNGTWQIKESVLSFTYTIGPLEYIEHFTIVEHNDSIVKILSDTSPTLDINIIFEIVPEGWGIFGCMNPNYANYNPEAVCPAPCNQGGCMDPIACNYNEFATYDDGSCYFVFGCMESSALNYDPTACIDDGSCCFVSGCMDVTADNYDPTACIDDGSCIYNALVYVPDDNFEQALINLGYDNVMDDYVLRPNIDGVTNLLISNLGIADLTGIEKFTALTQLSCYGNQLTSLDVSNNTALTYLDCNFNQLTSLDVSNNTSLTSLQCVFNPLGTLDVSQNTALTVLYCDNNQLTSLDVSQNTALSELLCKNNQLISLDLSNNTNLTLLQCNNNSNLNCIEVSDVSWANSIPNLIIDPQQYFSLSCP